MKNLSAPETKHVVKRLSALELDQVVALEAWRLQASG